MPPSTAPCRLIADARVGLEELSANLGSYKAPAAWTKTAKEGFKAWMKEADAVTAATNALPSDAQVIGAVQRALGRDISVLCASGGLPGELHKLWQASTPSSYHLEYGFSCMGYEIAGGIGMKMAQPEREVVVMVGDGSYLMMNSEIATCGDAGHQDHHRRARQSRLRLHHPLQKATGGARFNNLFEDAQHETLPEIDFAAHAREHGGDRREGRHRSPNSNARSRRPRAMTARPSWSSTPIR